MVSNQDEFLKLNVLTSPLSWYKDISLINILVYEILGLMYQTKTYIKLTS